MTQLPIISGRACVRALEKAGYYVSSQKGSHIKMSHADLPNTVIVPDHKTLKKGTLRSIIRYADLTVDEFVELL